MPRDRLGRFERFWGGFGRRAKPADSRLTHYSCKQYPVYSLPTAFGGTSRPRTLLPACHAAVQRRRAYAANTGGKDSHTLSYSLIFSHKKAAIYTIARSPRRSVAEPGVCGEPLCRAIDMVKYGRRARLASCRIIRTILRATGEFYKECSEGVYDCTRSAVAQGFGGTSRAERCRKARQMPQDCPDQVWYSALIFTYS